MSFSKWILITKFHSIISLFHNYYDKILEVDLLDQWLKSFRRILKYIVKFLMIGSHHIPVFFLRSSFILNFSGLFCLVLINKMKLWTVVLLCMGVCALIIGRSFVLPRTLIDFCIQVWKQRRQNGTEHWIVKEMDFIWLKKIWNMESGSIANMGVAVDFVHFNTWESLPFKSEYFNSCCYITDMYILFSVMSYYVTTIGFFCNFFLTPFWFSGFFPTLSDISIHWFFSYNLQI